MVVVRPPAEDGEFLVQVAVDEGDEGDGREEDVADEGGYDGGEGGGEARGVGVSGGVLGWRGMGE